MPKKWTPIEDKALARLFQEGKTDKQIFDSKILPGRSGNAIHIRRSDIGAVSYTKEPYKIKNKPSSKKRPTKAIVAPGTQLTIGLHAKPLKKSGPSILDESNCKGMEITFTKKELPPLPNGATGSFAIFAYDDRVDFQARGLAPRQVIQLLAKVIQNII